MTGLSILLALLFSMRIEQKPGSQGTRPEEPAAWEVRDVERLN